MNKDLGNNRAPRDGRTSSSVSRASTGTPPGSTASLPVSEESDGSSGRHQGSSRAGVGIVVPGTDASQIEIVIDDSDVSKGEKTGGSSCVSSQPASNR